MKKSKLFLLMFLCGLLPHIYGMELQQPINISGVVVDETEFPLPGVTIAIQGTTLGTSTDADGKFTLTVPNAEAVLLVSYVGYQSQEITVGTKRTFNIVMAETSTALDEVVVVAYGTQKKVSVTAAIATVQTKELKQSSAANLSSALAGRLPGLTALQTSGQPGNDVVNLYLRGIGTMNDASPLILIDGIPRDNISVLDPNEIASVSILKDASATAVFGVRGANGAILITTRRGAVGKPELSISIDQSYQQLTTSMDRVHSWTWAEMRNRAYLNDNPSALDADLPYTQYMIDKYRSGEDPVFYPDRDVYHDYFRDWTPQTRLNMNLSGGTDKTTYFLNVGYIGQGGNFYTEPKSKLGYDPSYRMDRYTFRSNVDYNLTNNLKVSLNIGTYIQKLNSPQAYDLFNNDPTWMLNDMMGNVWTTPPTDPGPKTPAGHFNAQGVFEPYQDTNGNDISEGEMLRASGGDRNTWGEINRRGYRQYTSTQLNSSLKLDWGLDFITKGLSAWAMIAFDFKAFTNIQGVKSYNIFDWKVARSDAEESAFSGLRTTEPLTVRLIKGWATTYYMNIQAAINYARTFGSHNVGAMVLFQRDNYENQNYGVELPYNVIGTVGRLTYAFDDRYLAEINVGYNGTEQFAPANRFGFFPAASVGWVVSNEQFLKNNDILTNLKIRASYGKVGNDKISSTRFLYQSDIQSTWNPPGTYVNSLGREKVISQGLMANEHIQWEESVKQNIGVDIGVLSDFTFTADFFNEDRTKILISRGTVPVLQGVPIGYIPRMNMGEMTNKGYELELTYQKIVNKDFSLTLKGNYAYNNNKVINTDEPMLSEEYAYRFRSTGYSRGQRWGYRIDKSNGNGFLNTAEELEWAREAYNIGGLVRLGDLKYVDVNDDGLIDDKDQVPLGYPEGVPRISYGFSALLNYKNVDFSFLFSGIAQSTRGWIGGTTSEQGPMGFYNGWHFHAWTQERYDNGEKILYPALSAGTSASMQTSEFFLFDRSYLRLKTIELGYNLPQRWLKTANISRVRVYFNGNNLLCWNKYPVKTVDPETSSVTSYPIVRMGSIGLNVVF